MWGQQARRAILEQTLLYQDQLDQLDHREYKVYKESKAYKEK
jgi:hypothetical protein